MRDDKYINSDFQSNQNDVKDFVRNLSEKEPSDLTAIITRYLSYRPETVEAALIVSVDKGLISYDSICWFSPKSTTALSTCFIKIAGNQTFCFSFF